MGKSEEIWEIDESGVVWLNGKEHRPVGRPRKWGLSAKGLIRRVRVNASRRGLKLDLKPMDVRLNKYCPYLDIELSYEPEDRHADNYATLDRIDNRQGYVAGNVEVISRKANTMKSNASIPELVTFAKHVLAKHERHTE